MLCAGAVPAQAASTEAKAETQRVSETMGLSHIPGAEELVRKALASKPGLQAAARRASQYSKASRKSGLSAPPGAPAGSASRLPAVAAGDGE